MTSSILRRLIGVGLLAGLLVGCDMYTTNLPPTPTAVQPAPTAAGEATPAPATAYPAPVQEQPSAYPAPTNSP